MGKVQKNEGTQVEVRGGKLNLRQDAESPKGKAKQALADFDVALADLTGNWDGLTAQQQRDAQRRMLIIVARAVEWLLVRE